MASMKKPVKKSASTSNRVKPVSSAAKVRMADEKMTKAANAKAPRYPRGMEGYGMNTSKGSVIVDPSVYKNPQTGRAFPGYPTTTDVYARGKNKKVVDSLIKSTMKSKAAGVTGKKYSGFSGPTSAYTGGKGYSKLVMMTPSKPASVKKKSPKKGK